MTHTLNIFFPKHIHKKHIFKQKSGLRKKKKKSQKLCLNARASLLVKTENEHFLDGCDIY